MEEKKEVNPKMENLPAFYKGRRYTKQLLEHANQALRENEISIYCNLFESIAEENKLQKPEELTMLHNLVINQIRILRLQNLVLKEGDFYTTEKHGEEITKPNEASYLLGSILSQLRSDLRELCLTRRETVKKQIGLAQNDFTSFLSDVKTVDAVEVEIPTEKKEKKK